MEFKISGKVIYGQGYGKALGFPTANLERREYVRRKMKIRMGVWAGYAIYNLQAKTYKLKAGIVIGPLDKYRLPKIEAHLIGFRGDLYGKKLTVTLQKYLRPFKKFKTENELKSQINKDIKNIRTIKYG